MSSRESASDASQVGQAPHGERFATTRWSLVAAAGVPGTDSDRHEAALGTLCESYWFPVYAFARRRGASAEDAQDLVQGFFTRLIEKGDVANADPLRGRFRTFLLACFKHYSANERERAGAAKRGGGQRVFTLHGIPAEERLANEGDGAVDPERAFERAWAHTLLETVFVRLRGEYEAAGKAVVFVELKDSLGGDGGSRTHSERAEALGITEGAVKVAVHRLRQRYGELLRHEIGDTLAAGEDIEDALRRLFESLAK
jgi:RNA polymerase sigma-70 factor (ECF subfamily)